MKTFLRENPTIAFGLALPLLLVVVFLLLSGVPSLLVAPPQYDLLFATEYYNYQKGLKISVINKQVQITNLGQPQNNQNPRIWRYTATTGAVKEIAFILPPDPTLSIHKPNTADTLSPNTLIEVPDLKGLTVDSSSIAPDGYEFSIGNRSSRNIFGGLFYSSRYRHDAILTKNGRSIHLPDATGRYYRGNTHFIGWVVSP
ncbi:hypothetical protein [Amphritea japonica]|uniref:Sulfoxide reductase catalytic subunit YedY n=1 Tax=Amphritea japonica ATCC BAA-1530 TaxID=1278309 RepID=A0A7R6P3J8_9GAMM|nr:hypothetical protein [Amphritea japonica]BBB26553.1 sulfoxide reductase catalytic subunit YedY [Amphritea japonica ATCC BAA-1530]